MLTIYNDMYLQSTGNTVSGCYSFSFTLLFFQKHAHICVEKSNTRVHTRSHTHSRVCTSTSLTPSTIANVTCEEPPFDGEKHKIYTFAGHKPMHTFSEPYETIAKWFRISDIAAYLCENSFAWLSACCCCYYGVRVALGS